MCKQGAENMKEIWSCIPKEETENKYAIYFSITDNYSFAVANILMGMRHYSTQLLDRCDVIVYHTGISETNKKLLKQIHRNTLFEEMVFPSEWDEILEHPRTKKWGSFVICKFFGFDLINRYEKVLGLDADMHVRGDISPIFEIEQDMAWRPIVAWKPNEVFADIIESPDNNILAGNGGLMFFNDSIKKCKIDVDTIRNAFEDIKNLRPGGIDELVLAWVAHKNRLSVCELDVCDYNTSVQAHKTESKLVHFLDYKTIQTKPWKNPVAFLYYTDWAENYEKWLELGGNGLVNFSEEDYFQCFSFDRVKNIDKKTKEIEQKNKRIAKLEQELENIKHSASWKITEPLRMIAKKVRNLKKKVKSCLKN